MKRWPILLAASLLACAGTQTLEPPSSRPARASKKPAASGVPALPAHRLTSVPFATYGPYLETGPSGAVAVWAAVDKAGARGWYALSLDPSGTARGQPVALAPAPSELGVVVVRALGSEFLVLSSAPAERGAAVTALWLGAEGRTREAPAKVADSAGVVLWLEAFQTERGALVLWASESGRAADVYATAIEPASPARPPRLVASGVSAWQAARVERGVALASVNAPANAGAGPVQLVTLDETGAPRGGPLAVSTEKSAAFDLDMIAVGGRLVLAWSDSRDVEARVYLATVDAAGKLVDAAKPALPPFGEEALVRLVAPFGARSPGYLVWEGLQRRGRGVRSLQIAPVGPDGKIGAERAEIDIAADDGSVPELRASASGLSALTLAPLCEREGSCEAPSVVPMFVGFDGGLNPIAAEPLRLSELGGEPAALAWNLSCGASQCLALAALGSSPAPVFAVELAALSKTWLAPARKRTPGRPPRAAEISAVARTEPLADIAALPIANRVLTGFVTYFDPTTPNTRLKTPAPDGRFDPLRARLEVQAFPEQGPAPPAQTLSLRARSLGGISIAAAPGRDDALVGWTALDNEQPEVFVTSISGTGKKLAQRMLTRKKGEVSDVATAAVADGWIVAWIDERHGDPELYAAKLNRALVRVGPERRLTTHAGAASGVALLARGDEVLAVWADARESAEPGAADLFGLRLAARDAAPLGPETRLTSTRANSHSPVLAATTGAVTVAWIEGGDPNDGAAVQLATLAAGTLQPSEPVRIAAQDGAPTALALDCSPSACRLALVVSGASGNWLEGVSLDPSGRVGARGVLAELGSAGAQAVPPALVGRALYYADQSDGQTWLRRMLIDWE